MRIQIITWVACECEAQARLQPDVISLNIDYSNIVARSGDPVLGEWFTHGIAFVAAGVIEALVVAGLLFQEGARSTVLLAIRRMGEGVVALDLS